VSEAFNEIYQRDILPSLASIDNQRKKSKKILIVFLFILFAIVLIPLAKKMNLTGALSSDELKLIALGLGILAVLLVVQCYSKYKEYKIVFKKNVVEKIIKSMFAGLDYKSNQFIKESTYKDSQLFPQKYDIYKGEDYCFGKIGQMDIEFSELQTSYRSATTDTGGGSQNKWNTIFHGFFMHADLHKKIATRTLVFPIVPDSMIGEVFAGALKKTNGVLESRGQVVQIDNAKFKKDFIVFADDATEATALIGIKMQEQLILLREKFYTLPCVAFVNNRVFFALQNNADHFEPRLWNAISKSEIYFFYELIHSLISIAQDIERKQN
jgi:hypothetical protein